MNSPLVSVIMSVYNTKLEYLNTAIESILNQTYRNIEFVIVDDGSSKEIAEFILSFRDSRIRYYKNKKNIGLTKSLNRAVKISNGKYIARMDADDISNINRIEKQIDFLEENKKVGVLGTQATLIGRKNKEIVLPCKHEAIKARLLISNPMVHPTTVIRTEIIRDNLYDENFKTSQDYELWSRLIWKTQFANLKESLLLYRDHENQISVIKNSNQNKIANAIRINLLSLIVDNTDKSWFNALNKSFSNMSLNEEEILEVWRKSNIIISENREKNIFIESELEKIFSENLDRSLFLNPTLKIIFRKDLRIKPNHAKNKYVKLKYLGKLYKLYKLFKLKFFSDMY